MLLRDEVSSVKDLFNGLVRLDLDLCGWYASILGFHVGNRVFEHLLHLSVLLSLYV